MIKKLLIALAFLLPVGAFAQQSFTPSLIPLTTARYFLGTTTPSTISWKGLIVDQICLTADVCRTTWPTGSGGGGGGGTFSTSTIGGYLINYPNNATDVVTIGSVTATSSAKFFFDPNISLANILGLSSTTNLFVQASSTLQNFTGLNATTSQATSTNLFSTKGTFTNLFFTNATGTNLTTTGTAIFGDTGGIYANAVGSGVGTLGFNSWGGGYTAGVAGYGALFQLAPSTGTFNMYLEGNASAGSAHSHTITLGWDNTGVVTIPLGVLVQASSTFSVGASFAVSTTTGRLYIPASANPTIQTLAGHFAIDTTSASTSLRFSDGTAERVVYDTQDRAFSFASSTLAYAGAYGASGTTTILLMNPYRPTTMVSFYCKTDSGTAHLAFGTGSATTTDANCSTTGVRVNLAASNTWVMNQDLKIDVGRITGTPSFITVTATLRTTSD